MEDADFIRALRSALNNLYEPDQLRSNPLVALLGYEGRVDAPAALAETVVDGIEGVRNSGMEASVTRAWLAHDVLHLRYVRGYSREEVARKLNMSDRQLSRELRSAIEMLAVVLWRKHPEAQTTIANGSTDVSQLEKIAQDEDSGDILSEGELGDGVAWLREMPVESPTGWRDELDSVLALMQPLMEQHQSYLQVQFDAPIPNLLVAQNTLRQTLLLLLGWLIPVASHRTIVLRPAGVEDKLVLDWRIEPPVEIPEGDDALEVPRQLLAHRGGSLEVERIPDVPGGDALCVSLTIPALAQVPVLVIDDNLDTIQLFQRYVQGTRYALVGVSTPEEVPRALERVQPCIILLDVMMPQVDGWDMLARLRQLPEAEQRAIVVCSIMPLESVARSLGANGFLQKPVLPQALLQTLDQYAVHS